MIEAAAGSFNLCDPITTTIEKDSFNAVLP
jgi:hypothetical protein